MSDLTSFYVQSTAFQKIIGFFKNPPMLDNYPDLDRHTEILTMF